MSYSCQRVRLLGKFSQQTLINRISCHLHIFIYITHLTKISTCTWKLFMLAPMEKSKAEKSPWIKKTKKRPKEDRKSSILSSKEKKKLTESNKGSWFVRQFLDILFFRGTFSAINPFGEGFCLCLYLWHLCPLLHGCSEMNCTEQDKKLVAMQYYSQEIVIYCHRHYEVLFFHWFAVLLGVTISGRARVVYKPSQAKILHFIFGRIHPLGANL